MALALPLPLGSAGSAGAALARAASPSIWYRSLLACGVCSTPRKVKQRSRTSGLVLMRWIAIAMSALAVVLPCCTLPFSCGGRGERGGGEGCWMSQNRLCTQFSETGPKRCGALRSVCRRDGEIARLNVVLKLREAVQLVAAVLGEDRHDGLNNAPRGDELLHLRAA